MRVLVKFHLKKMYLYLKWGCPDSDLSECIPVRVVIKKKKPSNYSFALVHLTNERSRVRSQEET